MLPASGVDVRDLESELEEIVHCEPPHQTQSHDPAYLVYTSGTTGYPKGVLHAHRAMIGREPAAQYWFDFAADGQDRIVHSGKFNWNSEKFPLMTQPDASYHGVRWATDIGPLCPVAFAIRMRVIPLRNLGACISPDNAWMFLQGIETLPLRMERHCENALAVAKHLKNHPKVEWVRFPGLPDDPNFELNKKYLRGKGGSMVVFGIKGGNAAGTKFIESLKLFSHLANVGDAKSLAIHPATTTHSQLTPEQQAAGGITPELVRLSVGIEHIDDILADLDQALAAAAK